MIIMIKIKFTPLFLLEGKGSLDHFFHEPNLFAIISNKNLIR